MTPRRECVERTRHERVEARAEVACQTRETLKAWRNAVLPIACGAHTREYVCDTRRRVVRMRRALRALARLVAGGRGILPGALRALRAGGHAWLIGVCAGTALEAHFVCCGAHTCRELSWFAGSAT
jgi:hypothetical protein